MRYLLVTEDDLVKLEDEVNAWYRQGWKAFGSPLQLQDGSFVQAMVRD